MKTPMNLFTKNKIEPYKIPIGFRNFSDGYTESPFAHGPNAQEGDREDEYFMQWLFPLKLQRVSLRTAVGFRFIYLYAKDLWNNRLGVKVENDDDKTLSINKKLVPYLMGREWFREMEKLSGFEREQGEAILLCYYGDEGKIENYKTAVTDNSEILKVESFSPLNYNIPEFDEFGDPEYYNIEVKSPDSWRGTMTIRVHPSRVMRKMNHNLEFRFNGYSDLAAIYDAIVIYSTILKAAGEAAFRWGTGHPIFLTKDIIDTADLETLKTNLGNVTRRSWHALPSEKIDRIEMLGQAGSMLNLKSLADIALDNIVIGSAFPKPILLGETEGVMGSEVTERVYFARMDRDHTDLDWFVRAYFKKDKNVRKILLGTKDYSIDWGIREVFNRMDEADYEQKMVSIGIAMTQVSTINEARKQMGLPDIRDEEGGDVILGLLPYLQLQMDLAMMFGAGGENTGLNMGKSENQTNTSMKEKSKSTTKQAASMKEPEKNKRVAPVTKDAMVIYKDAVRNLRSQYSINSLAKQFKMHDKTIYKLLDFAEEDKE
ncbi:MAG: DUF1073 domain-containing protein [PVC group bacterium]|nr:DUF1073 domain-containing protein [PVC group bacterium]